MGLAHVGVNPDTAASVDAGVRCRRWSGHPRHTRNTRTLCRQLTHAHVCTRTRTHPPTNARAQWTSKLSQNAQDAVRAIKDSVSEQIQVDWMDG